uniref:Uncharacterized protein n=1 Tax=Arion vulgaris TaxID=1028688 RepID=A0A0B6ZME1_9EUPU
MSSLHPTCQVSNISNLQHVKSTTQPVTQHFRPETFSNFAFQSPVSPTRND